LKLKCVTIVVLHLRGYPAVRPELDLAEQEDQITHEVSLDEEIDPEISLGIFYIDKFVSVSNLIGCGNTHVILISSFSVLFFDRYIQARPQFLGERKVL